MSLTCLRNKKGQRDSGRVNRGNNGTRGSQKTDGVRPCRAFWVMVRTSNLLLRKLSLDARWRMDYEGKYGSSEIS